MAAAQAAPPAASLDTPDREKTSAPGAKKYAREGTMLTLSFPSDQNLLPGSFVTIGSEKIFLGSGLSCTGTGPYSCTATLKVTGSVPASDGPVSYSIHAVGSGGATDEPATGTTLSDITLERGLSNRGLTDDDETDASERDKQKESTSEKEKEKSTWKKIVDAVKDVIQIVRDTVIAWVTPKEKEVATGKDEAPGQNKSDDDCLPRATGKGQTTAPGQQKTNGRDEAPGQLKKKKDCPPPSDPVPTPDPAPTPVPDPVPTPDPAQTNLPVSSDPGNLPPTPTPTPDPGAEIPPIGGGPGTVPTPIPAPEPAPLPSLPTDGGAGQPETTLPTAAGNPSVTPSAPTPTAAPPTAGDEPAPSPGPESPSTSEPTPTEVAVLPIASNPPTPPTVESAEPEIALPPDDPVSADTPSVMDEIVDTVGSVTDSIVDLITPGPRETEMETATTPPGGTTLDVATGNPGPTPSETPVPSAPLADSTNPTLGMGGGEATPGLPPSNGLLDSFTDAAAGVGDAISDLVTGSDGDTVVPSDDQETDVSLPAATTDSSTGGTKSNSSAQKRQGNVGHSPDQSSGNLSPLKSVNSLAFGGIRSVDTLADRTATLLEHPFSTTLTLAAPLAQAGLMLGGLTLGELGSYLSALFNFGIISTRRKDKRYGIVFDALTGKPLRGARIAIKNAVGSTQRLLANGYGMYVALVPAGRYTLAVEKEGYSFPSKRLVQGLRPGHTTYRAGGEIVLDQPGILNLDIALDRVETASHTPSPLAIFYRSHEKLLRFFADILYYGGFTATALLTIIHLVPVHMLFLAAYILMFLLRRQGLAQTEWGEVFFLRTNKPAPFASVKALGSAGEMRQRSIADEYGRYYLFLERGRHTLRFECEDRAVRQARSLEQTIRMDEPIGMVAKRVKI